MTGKYGYVDGPIPSIFKPLGPPSDVCNRSRVGALNYAAAVFEDAGNSDGEALPAKAACTAETRHS